jgi:hypothetical protein
VLPIFVRKALAGEPLTVTGDGLQHRKFIYVEDLAAGHVLALDEAGKSQTFNLDGTEKVTILQIAETALKLTGSKMPVEHGPARPGDYGGVEVSSQHVKNVLGWEPRMNWEDGSKKTVAWLMEQAAVAEEYEREKPMRVRIHVDAVVARTPIADAVGGAPLRESGPELAVLGEPLAQTIEPLGHGLVVRKRERLCARVHLDAGNDPLLLQQLHQRGAVGSRLPDRLVEQDHTADVVARAFGAEQHLAVVAAIRLRGLHADGIEALLDRSAALVGGEDALAGCDERTRRCVQLVEAHVLTPIQWCRVVCW